MTTFAALESSAAGSRPVELISFDIGSTSYRYTTGPLDIVHGGFIYAAEGITRGKVVLNSAAHDQACEIAVPATNAFAKLYYNVVPAEIATCTILRLQRGEVPTFNTTQLVYQGDVKGVKFQTDGRKASVSVQSFESGRNGQMLAYTYQGPCNHQLYSALCGVDPALHTHTGTVTAASGNTITVAGAGASGLDFTGGFVRPTTHADFRDVMSQSGDVLTLLLPFVRSPVGNDVDCVAGCDHLLDGDCQQVYDNGLRNGGFAFSPVKNPFGGSIL